MIYKCANAYYFRSINAIGGIESHLWYVAKKYGQYDINVFYKDADPNQLRRLRKLVNCVELKKEDKVVCDKLFCCFNREILDQCEAKEKNLVLHGDYEDMVARGQLHRVNLPIDKRIDNYYGVSKQTCDGWERLTGIKAKNIYEPVVLDEPNEPLLLISATRLTQEKGWERMVKLADAMTKNNINYIWLVYTNSKPEFIPKGMIFQRPNLNINQMVGIADGFVQLSDNEGYCLSVVEALLRGVPCITTPIPIFKKELGLNVLNSIECDFNMKDIPIDRIRHLKELKKMMPKYVAKEDKWMEVIEKKPSNYKLIKVKATNLYKANNITDNELGYVPSEDEEWEVTDERLKKLQNTKWGCLVEVIEEKKETKKRVNRKKQVQ